MIWIISSSLHPDTVGHKMIYRGIVNCLLHYSKFVEVTEENETSTRHDGEGDHARRNDAEEDEGTKRNAQDSLRIRVFSRGPEQEKAI